MIWDATDLATLLDSDMPGYQLATLAGGATVGGLFRDGFAPRFGGLVGDDAPDFSARAADVSAVTVGATLTIAGTSYTVAAREPISTASGMTRLILK